MNNIPINIFDLGGGIKGDYCHSKRDGSKAWTSLRYDHY